MSELINYLLEELEIKYMLDRHLKRKQQKNRKTKIIEVVPSSHFLRLYVCVCVSVCVCWRANATVLNVIFGLEGFRDMSSNRFFFCLFVETLIFDIIKYGYFRYFFEFLMLLYIIC